MFEMESNFGESEVEHMKRKSGVDKWKMEASEGAMLLKIVSICMFIFVFITVCYVGRFIDMVIDIVKIYFSIACINTLDTNTS